MACISYELDGCCFLLAFSAGVSGINVPQNVPLVIIGTNNLPMDCCHKSSTSGMSLPEFKCTMLLFYGHLTLQGLRHVFHVEFCSSVLLLLLVIF
jgi:hypothetical protein